MDITVYASHFLSSDIIGGGDRVFIELCKVWSKENDVTVICPPSGYELCSRYGLKAQYRLLRRDALESPRTVILIPILYAARALRTFRLGRPSSAGTVIYTPGDFISDVIAASLVKLFYPQTKWFGHVFYVIPPPLQRNISFVRDTVSFFLQRLSFLLLRRFADAVVVLSSTAEKQLAQLRFDSAKVFKSSGGVDMSTISSSQPDSGHLYDACFVGRIHPGKGALDLIEIWKRVVSKRPESVLAIVGSGSEYYLKQLGKLISDNGVTRNVRLLGFLPSPYRVMKSSKLLLYPDHEAGYGWGLSVTEALACSTPVIAYDFPVYREVYSDGVRYAEFGDTDKFADLTIELLDDPVARQELGRRGNEAVKKYDWNGVAAVLMVRVRELATK